MHQVEDEPMETLHIYIEREQPPHPSLLPLFLSVFALSILVAIGILTPYKQPEQRASIRVPAVLLPIRTFRASAQVIPTGVKTYPATTAHGILTITNGSVISQNLPAGFTLMSSSGISVVTDIAAFIPAGNANGYGRAYVSAHALISGRQGNIPALAVDSIEGSSVYIRNLSAFSGGRDAYSAKFVTAQDRQTALNQARQELIYQSSGLHYPCKEYLLPTTGKVIVTWRCQFVTYEVPSYMHVLATHLVGKSVLVDVVFVARPERFWVK
jgi:hypothetical protein